MKNKYVYSFLIASAAFILQGFSGAADNSCKENIRAIYAKLERISAPIKGHTYYIKYQVNTYIRDTATGSIATSAMQVWTDGNLMEIHGDEVKMFRDLQETFTVLPQKKTVIRSDADSRSWIEQKRKTLRFIQDTLFFLSSVENCISLGNGIKSVTLQVNEKGRKRFGIHRMSFWIDERKEQIKKIKTDFVQKPKEESRPEDILSIEYVFDEISFDYKKKKLRESVSGMFVNNAGKLVHPYKMYSLIDTRKR